MERIGLEPGAEVGGYRIVAPLGTGGMGAVYRAADGGGTEVALKLLHPHIGADPAARERLRREVSALQRLRHPRVAAVLDAEADSSEAFIVTELVDGENLTEHVRSRRPIDVLGLAEGLFEVLSAVHAAGVVHRDLKPSNVVLTEAGPVLIDFGLAQGMEDSRMTSTGIVLGTPGYLAPELLDGAEPDPTSDWWGWAAVLAFALTGRDPFGARPVEAVLARARSGEVDLDGVDPSTAGALRRALAPDPRRRAAPVEVLAALRGELPDDDGDGDDEGATLVLGASRSDPTSSGAVGTSASDPGGTGSLAAVAGAHAARGPGSGEAANDGHTRAFDPSHHRTSGGDAVHDDAVHDDAVHDDAVFDDAVFDDAVHDRAGLDDTVDDDELPAEDDPAAEDELYAAPVPARRPVTLVALLLAAVALAPLAPGVVLLVVAAATVLFGTVQSDAAALEARRERRGPRRGDGFRAAVSSPWHLLRGTAIALPSLLVAASVVVVVGGVSWWLLDTRRVILPVGAPASEPWAYLAAIALAVLLGLVTLWFGPFARATRLGARRTLGRIAPGRGGALVVITLALVGIAVAAVLLATAEPTWWWPLPGPPSLA